ncbi:MAG: thioesterase [Firmicutes bacterium]|nr:thioesterase [Bacillota bacterium]
MREGLREGMSATVHTVVTDDMVARLGGQMIHPVLATARMIEWMEWAGRSLILPYLDDDEDAVGFEICVTHTAPTLVGESFSATATFRARAASRIVTDVVAANARGVIGQGVFTQVLIPKAELKRRLEALRKDRPPNQTGGESPRDADP